MNAPKFKSFLKDDLNLFYWKRKAELSAITLENELIRLRSFDACLSRYGFNDIDPDFINLWISSLNGLSEGSINNYISSVRVFLRYENALRDKHYFVPEYRMYPDTYIPHYFTSNDKEAIYSSVDNFTPGSNNVLPWIKAELPMIVRILDGCGTRVAEVLQLRIQDVDFENAVLIIRNAKRGKQRRVPMADSLFKILEDYCYAMGIYGNPDAFLFPRKDQTECLKVSDVSSCRFTPILEKLGIRKKCSLKKYERGPCLYDYRHTFSVNSFKQLHRKGLTIDDTVCYLSIYLGHDDLSETQRYLKHCLEIFPEEIDKFYDAADALAPKEDKWERWEL